MFAFEVEKWRKWVATANPMLDPFPEDLALNWIRMESGGSVCSVGCIGGRAGCGQAYPGHVYEAGLAQTYFDTPATVKYGVTSLQLRSDCAEGQYSGHPTTLTDARRLLHARVAVLTMIDARSAARSKLSAAGVRWPETSADFWAFVKLNHVLPTLQRFLAPCKKALGFEPTWLQFRAWVEQLSDGEIDAVVAISGRRASFPRYFDNAEEFAGVSPGAPASKMKYLVAIGVGGLLLYLTKHYA